jgi:tetratricopeptide (TPR) repeat protein
MKWFGRLRGSTTQAPAAAPQRATAELAAVARRTVQDLLEQGEADGAADAAAAALDAHPDDPELNTFAGEADLARGDAEAALDAFTLALHYDSSSIRALQGRVRALERLGRPDEVPGAWRALLEVVPTHRGALYALALHAERAGAFGAAIDLLERLVSHHPTDADALNMLGLIRARELGDFAVGEGLLRRALAAAPANLDAMANLGWVLAESGQTQEGLALLDRVLAAEPGDAELRLMRAVIELKQGNYARGWQDYGARMESKLSVPRPFRFPDWQGESPAGKRVLVYGEQGLGDQIMFASCLPDLLREAATCVLDCAPRLAPLFQRSFPSVRVFGTAQDDPAPAWLDAVGPVDVQIPIGELPRRYRRCEQDFPAHRGYLDPDPVKVDLYKQRLAALGSGPKVGLSWRGGTKTSRRDMRSIGLAGLTPLLAGFPAHWVSLQYTSCDDEIAAFRERTGIPVHHWQDAIDDYDDTAALVTALDVVVSVCTAVVHLAGALGRPALVVVPIAAEWRYGAAGEAMPWYPTVRLFRQTRTGEWGDVLARILAALQPRS